MGIEGYFDDFKPALEIFNNLNDKLFKNSNDPKITEMVSEIREMIESAQNANEQYVIVAGYMKAMKKKFGDVKINPYKYNA